MSQKRQKRNVRSNYINLNPCKCCLDKGFYKKLWSENYYEDNLEVYGEMLIEVFSLPWPIPDENAREKEQICDTCIERLRDAWNFKQQVLAVDMQLQAESNETESEIVNNEIDVKAFDVEHYSSMESSDGIKHENVDMELEDDDVEYLIVAVEESEDVEEEKHDDVIYLEDDNSDEIQLETEDTSNEAANRPEPTIPSNSTIPSTSPTHTSDHISESKSLIKSLLPTKSSDQSQSTKAEQMEQKEERKRKWPRKKRKDEKTKLYKLYSEEDLRKCIADVKNNKLSIVDAAHHYGVPVKTLRYKLKENNQKKIKPVPPEDRNEVRYKLFKEIKIILTYTNAVPFKSKTARYYCAYCSTDGPFFDEPDDLRAHTRTVHFDERVKVIEQIMRPYFLNYVIKLDIDNFHCTVCCTAILSWNDMFIHLKEKHEIDLDLAYSRVVPYILQNDISCVLCKEKFPNFHHLDGHMNSHYTNYICPECGDTFLTYHRYMKHTLLHNTGKFPCEECGKVFAMEIYRKKHIKLVHNQEKMVKCLYCSERFTTEYPRHLHVMEKHPEKVKSITCELCGLQFDWRPYYLAHIRRKHKKVKCFKCKYCGESFTVAGDLRKHESMHKGNREYECPVCEKTFATLWALKQHARVHKEGLAQVRAHKKLKL